MTYQPDPQLIEKEVAQSVHFVLVPAVASWIIGGVVFGLGWHMMGVVVLGLGLTAASFLMMSRFLEQLMRLVGSNYELLLLRQAREPDRQTKDE